MGIRFIKPETERIALADVARRAHAALVTELANAPQPKDESPSDALARQAAATEKLAKSQARVDAAIEDGDYVIFKKRLSHGERDAMLARMRANDGKDLRAAELAGYLVSWSSSVPYSLDMPEDDRIATINALDAESYDEIRDALKAHHDAQQAEKKRGTGTSAFAPTSSSLAAVG